VRRAYARWMHAGRSNKERGPFRTLCSGHSGALTMQKLVCGMHFIGWRFTANRRNYVKPSPRAKLTIIFLSIQFPLTLWFSSSNPASTHTTRLYSVGLRTCIKIVHTHCCGRPIPAKSTDALLSWAKIFPHRAYVRKMRSCFIRKGLNLEHPKGKIDSLFSCF